jgi:hypothetical protein
MSTAAKRLKGPELPEKKPPIALEPASGSTTAMRTSTLILSHRLDDGTSKSLSIPIRSDDFQEWCTHNFPFVGPPTEEYPVKEVLKVRTRHGQVEIKVLYAGFEYEGPYWRKLGNFCQPGNTPDRVVAQFARDNGIAFPVVAPLL